MFTRFQSGPEFALPPQNAPFEYRSNPIGQFRTRRC
jgi:hypothetical protein